MSYSIREIHPLSFFLKGGDGVTPKKEKPKGCTTCKHGSYDFIWDDWSCAKEKRVIFHPERREDCPMYEKKSEQTN